MKLASTLSQIQKPRKCFPGSSEFFPWVTDKEQKKVFSQRRGAPSVKNPVRAFDEGTKSLDKEPHSLHYEGEAGSKRIRTPFQIFHRRFTARPTTYSISIDSSFWKAPLDTFAGCFPEIRHSLLKSYIVIDFRHSIYVSPFQKYNI
ncbi:MAG: hypothetical protein K5657_04240 [Desulfovibrio sp.]|nr:hypothetical protein [Desulfovibrio sp.]